MEKKKSYYTPASNKASQRYQQKHLSQVRFWVKKEEKIAIEQEAKARGLSVKRFIGQAINDAAGKQLVSWQESDEEE